MKFNRNPPINRVPVSLEFLMSRFAVQRRLWLAKAIVCQIENYLEHSEIAVDERARYHKILPVWQAITEHMEQEEPSGQGWRLSLSLFYKQRLQAQTEAC
jgi:hypothetical protein